MLTLRGPPALSAFRIAKLQEPLKRAHPNIRAVQASYVHFVETERALDRAELATLDRLYETWDRAAGPRHDPEVRQNAALLRVLGIDKAELERRVDAWLRAV